MQDSLLVALRSYRPRPNRDPLEDFVTEAFAWTLRSHPSLGDALLLEVDDKAEVSKSRTGNGEWDWNTQVSLDSGIADMIVRGEHRTYVFEHKVWAEARAEQIDDYRRSIEADEVVSILITGASWNYVGAEESGIEAPDVHMTWAEVSEILADESDKVEDDSRVEDFRSLLDHEGLGPRERLTEPDIRAVTRYQETVDNLVKLMRELQAQKENWAFAYELLSDPTGKKQPETRWSRNVPRFGRIALNLYSEYTPNINFGIIVDPDNIQTELVERRLGPDVAVFLHIPYSNLSKKEYREIATSRPYAELRKRLNQNASGSWTVFAPRGTDPGVNRHHPIVLQRPLARVLRGTTSVDGQRSAVLATLKEGVRLFLEGGEVENLREEINARID